MLLKEIAKLIEMARPAKICPDCGKSMAGHHFWYKGGWKCKKANRKDGEAAEGKKDEKKSDDKKAPTEKKEAPKASRPQNEKPKAKDSEHERDTHDEDPDVKTAEKEKGEKKELGQDISRSEINDINADSEDEARKQINDMFPNASLRQKNRAVNIWSKLQAKK